MNVTLRHAELLQHQGVVADPQKGMIYVDNLRSAKATDVYIFGTFFVGICSDCE